MKACFIFAAQGSLGLGFKVWCAFIGDLDSLKPEVRSFYAALGAVVIDESHNQDSTDLQKCLKHIMERPRKEGAGTPTIIAVGACAAAALCPIPVLWAAKPLHYQTTGCRCSWNDTHLCSVQAS